MKNQIKNFNLKRNLKKAIRNVSILFAVVAILAIYTGCKNDASATQNDSDTSKTVDKAVVDSVTKQDTTKKAEVNLKK